MLLRPELVDGEVTVRPGHSGDVDPVLAILAQPSVTDWWGAPPSSETLHEDLLAETDPVLLVIDVSATAAGGIQYSEDSDPRFRSASIDIFLGRDFQGRGVGTRAVAMLARFLFAERGHHRLTIDPAAANAAAIRSYAKVGFRPVGIMRQYELGPDGVLRDGLLMDLLRTDFLGSWLVADQHAGR